MKNCFSQYHGIGMDIGDENFHLRIYFMQSLLAIYISSFTRYSCLTKRVVVEPKFYIDQFLSFGIPDVMSENRA